MKTYAIFSSEKCPSIGIRFRACPYVPFVCCFPCPPFHTAAAQCPLHGSIGAKPLSGQAKPTSKAHSTATMRASFALTSAFAAAMSNIAFNGNMGVASAQRRFSAGSNIVNMRSCDEFPGRELDVTGTVTFLREINCREPTVRSV